MLPDCNGKKRQRSNLRTRTSNGDMTGKKSVDLTKSRNVVGAPIRTQGGEEGHPLIYRTTVGNSRPVVARGPKASMPSDQMRKLKVSLIGVEGVAYHSRNGVPARTTIKESMGEMPFQPPHRAQVHRNYASKRVYVSSFLHQSSSIKK